MFMKKQNKKRGFTITELVIVISVIAILSAVMIPTFSGIIGKSKDSAVLQEARNTFTDYIATIDYTEETAEDYDLLYKAANSDRWVVFNDGQFVDEVYKTELAALKALDATYTAADKCEKTPAVDYEKQNIPNLWVVTAKA